MLMVVQSQAIEGMMKTGTIPQMRLIPSAGSLSTAQPGWGHPAQPVRGCGTPGNA